MKPTNYYISVSTSATSSLDIKENILSQVIQMLHFRVNIETSYHRNFHISAVEYENIFFTLFSFITAMVAKWPY